MNRDCDAATCALLPTKCHDAGARADHQRWLTARRREHWLSLRIMLPYHAIKII